MSLTRLGATSIVRRELHTGWQVTAQSGPVADDIAGRSVPASVPGVVHLDLMTAGLIPDPYLDDNEAALAWIGLVDWTYETTFVVSEDDLGGAEHHDLVFDGLDTVATVSLNGETIAEVANQHRSYRIDVTGRLREGPNALTVAFRSPVRYANAQSIAMGPRERPYPLPYEAIRKSACNFGWDWGIATFTSGIWRPVRLESWSVARLAEVRVHASPAGEGGSVDAVVRVERAADVELTLELEVAGAQVTTPLPPGETEATIHLDLADVDRWWPAGYGEQPLYGVRVSLAEGPDTLDVAERRVGFRTVRWNTEPDAIGAPFQLVVNDTPVYVKGVNWIPDDAFPVRVDRARYTARLTQAKAAHLNLIRVWGGGIYESEDFYDVCDELGLLTWQDFLFACAAYPEEEPLRSEVAAEARENISRLAHRASLVLLTGNNENLWGYEDWGWKERLDGKTWGAHYYYDLFPGLVAELAPHVPYAPGSPFSPGDDHHPNDEHRGTMHLWEQWNRLDWPTYRDQRPRFVAEFGWQGPPAWSTLTRAIHDEPLTPESPGMIAHQKALEGNVKLTSGLVRHYRVPRDMQTWHWAMQLNQANAVSCALDHFRSLWPENSGAVVWQLNDCWPVTSWAAIDGDGREKPLFHALQNAFAPRVVTVQPRANGLAAIAGNDSGAPWRGSLVLSRRGFDGRDRDRAAVEVDIPPRASITVDVPDDLIRAVDAARDVLVADLDGTRGLWYFAEPRDSALERPGLRATVATEDGAHAVRVTTDTFVRDLTLLVDKLDPAARVDRGLVTLFPGESALFRITGVASLDAESVLAPEVARSGNQLVAR